MSELTKRDQFALGAMTGLIISGKKKGSRMLARSAYLIADRMLEYSELSHAEICADFPNNSKEEGGEE